MPSPRERHRNNIRMGIFVSAALLLALFVAVTLTGAIERFTSRNHQYIVEFTLDAGVRNLEKGSSVRVGGVPLGEVIEVRPRFEEHPFGKIDVIFAIDDRVKLYKDAAVYVSAPLIASEAWLDIPDVGTADAGDPPKGIIKGKQRGGMITTMLGQDNAARTSEILENVRQFSEVFTRAPQDYDEIVANVKQMTGDARGLVARIRHEDWPRWSESVTRVAQWAAEATESLDRLLAQGNDLLAGANDIVSTNRDELEQIVLNIEAASESVRELAAWLERDGRERLVQVLETGNGALEEARGVLSRLNREHFDQWATDLGFIMANANHASQQLKLAMTEIRRAPWKALHIPSTEEIEHEHLYDAMRDFALASADLNSASVAAQRILDNHSETLALNEEAVGRITRNLINRVERFEQAQQRLMDVLIQQ